VKVTNTLANLSEEPALNKKSLLTLQHQEQTLL
jgi:hypothetical protein